MRVDLNKLKELKQKMAELERLMENVVSNATRESIRVTENTRYNYNEYYVRSACEAVLTTARAIERENLRTTQRMQAKVKGLERAIETYMATEKKISGSKGFFNDFFKNFYNRFFKTSIKDSIGTTSWVLNTKSYSAGLGQKYGITSSTLRPQFAVGTSKDLFAQSKSIYGTAYMKPEALAKAIGANVSTVGMPPGTYWFSKDGTQKKVKAVDGLVPVKIVAEHFGVNMHGGSLVSDDTGKVLKNSTVISGNTSAQRMGNLGDRIGKGLNNLNNKYIAGPLNNINNKYGPVAATGVAVTGAATAAGSMAAIVYVGTSTVVTAGAVKAGALISAGATKITDAVNSGLAWTTARIGQRGVSALTNVGTNVSFTAFTDYVDGKKTSLREWELTVMTSALYGYALNPGSVAEFNVEHSMVKNEAERNFGWVKWMP